MTSKLDYHRILCKNSNSEGYVDAQTVEKNDLIEKGYVKRIYSKLYDVSTGSISIITKQPIFELTEEGKKLKKNLLLKMLGIFR